MARNVPYHDRDRSYEPDDPLNPYYDSYVPPSQEHVPNSDEPGSPSDPNDPWLTGPQDGNWEAWFMRNVASMAANPESLAALEAKLTPHGIKVLRNAEGIAGKIQLPNGQIVDVGQAFSGGNPGAMKWQWLIGDDGGASGTAPTADWFSQNAPAPDQYEQPGLPSYLQDPYTTTPRPEGLDSPYEVPSWQENYQPLTIEELLSDPGYRSRLMSGLDVREAAASAEGSLLSGGHLKRLERYGQEFAADEYSKANARKFDQYRQRYGQFGDQAALGLAGRQVNEGAYQSDVLNNNNQYAQRYNQYRDTVGDANNQFNQRYRAYQDAINNQLRLSEIGLNATTAGAPR